jgi:hypothetical protein
MLSGRPTRNGSNLGSGPDLEQDQRPFVIGARAVAIARQGLDAD